MKRKDILSITIATVGTLFLVAVFLLACYGFLGAIADIFAGRL